MNCDIPFEVWIDIYEEFQDCLRRAADTAHAERNACRVRFPVPPNRNIEPAVQCIESAGLKHKISIFQCSAEYRAAVCFNGTPPNPSSVSELSEDVLNVKKAAQALAIKTIFLASAVSITGRVMRATSAALPPNVDRTAAIDKGGIINGVAGTSIGGIGQYLRILGDDPPDPQFEDMVRLRSISPDDVLKPEWRDEPFFTAFVPILYEYLQAFITIEAFLASIEKAAGAETAGNTAKQRAHIRAAREYAGAFAEALTEAGTARLELADRLEPFLVVTSDRNDDNNRVRIDLSASRVSDRLSRVRPRALSNQNIIITLQDAVAVHTDLQGGTLDEVTSHAIQGLDAPLYGESDFVANIGQFVPSTDYFDQTPSAILRHPEFSTTEAALIAAFIDFAGT